jgi:glucose-1-phosphate thymidylyltransferase
MTTWGVIPAAGQGTRIQPLAFSKELLPVGSRHDGERERPRAVSDYLVERMVRGGASRLCFVISPQKGDIVEYYGGRWAGPPGAADIVYAVQERPQGLCDALFRARPLIRDEDEVLVGLPDTIWFPEDGLARLGADDLSFLLFPVERPERFDAVLTAEDGRVLEVQVKREGASTPWVWGAFRLRGAVLHALHDLWVGRDPRDEYLGTLVNAWIERGGVARGVRAGST